MNDESLHDEAQLFRKAALPSRSFWAVRSR
jgi:hypothetical protein